MTGRDEHSSRSGRIVYVFRPPDGPEYRAAQWLRPGSAHANVRPGDTVPVRFLVADPAVSVIAGEGESGFDFLIPVAMFPLFGLFFIGPFVLPRLRVVLRDRKAFRTGRVAAGTVVFVKQSVGWAWPGWPGWAAAQVFVSFQLPAGGSVEATATCQNEWLLQHLSPGAAVRIAYVPERPSRAVLLDAYVR